MNRRKATPMPEPRSESESSDDELTVVDAHIDACENYLEAFKLFNDDGYKVGMKGIHFTRAALAYAEAGNKEILKSAVKHAIKACTEAVNYFESKFPDEGIHFIKSAKLVIISLMDLK